MRSNILIAIFSSVCIMLFQSCQPGNLAKQSDQAPVDSSLYFQQVEVKDAFMDTLLSPGGQSAALTMRVNPPPPVEPVPPRFKELEGFRVQIFAGLDSINAMIKARQCRNVTPDSVYLFKEKTLFKIQTGDYPYRYQADSAKMNLRKNGFPDAWVVKSLVLIPVIIEGAIDSTAGDTSVLTDTLTQEQSAAKYKIQIMATAMVERAQSLVNDLITKNKFPAFFEKTGNMYKIMVGPYSTETEARQILDSVRKSGYPDAWLVQP